MNCGGSGITYTSTKSVVKTSSLTAKMSTRIIPNNLFNVRLLFDRTIIFALLLLFFCMLLTSCDMFVSHNFQFNLGIILNNTSADQRCSTTRSMQYQYQSQIYLARASFVIKTQSEAQCADRERRGIFGFGNTYCRPKLINLHRRMS